MRLSEFSSVASSSIFWCGKGIYPGKFDDGKGRIKKNNLAELSVNGQRVLGPQNAPIWRILGKMEVDSVARL